MSRERNESQGITSTESAKDSSDPEMEEAVLPLIVRYPRFFLWMPMLFLFISVSGLVNVVRGTYHGTINIAIVAVVGVFSLLHFLFYQTVFTPDGIEQRSWHGRTIKFGYLDIQQVELGGRNGFALLISDNTGRRIKVYGAINQLVIAQDILRRRVPHAFKEE